MKKIFKIAKLELSVLFYSPVAWLVFAIFMVQSSITFLDNVRNYFGGQEMGYDTGPATLRIFAGNSGLFSSIPAYLYLYIPILTMGLMSRETSSGSIKLLLSSPVKLRQIILGKFLAIISYGFMLLVLLMILSGIGVVIIEKVDIGIIISGLLGLFLLICTYSAIGLYMSCLTNYQVVAAISTLTIFAILRYVGNLWQHIDFVRDLTYFLSLSGRTNKMTAGLITTKDVCYYLIIIVTFLALCMLRLRSQRELKPWPVKAGRYVLLICGALLLGYFTSRPRFVGYLDTTADKIHTILPKNQELARQFKDKLTVTTYSNLLAPNVWMTLPAARNGDIDRLENYQRFIPNMEFRYVYYYH
ncbi:MAG TPA: ABC transporter permease subunit, partial [Chitinophaga sp.]